MALTRDSRHKRRNTGGRRKVHVKKRKFEVGRVAANTRLGTKKVTTIRAMGGNLKFRALRLETGNFSWGSQVHTAKTKILDVVYNASNNELVRTKTLVKNAIVQIDATPFRAWYEKHYGLKIAARGAKDDDAKDDDASGSKHVARKHAGRVKSSVPIDAKIAEQLSGGRILAAISSRPGQSGRADGYILEGDELKFYTRELARKKGRGAKK